MDRGLKCGSMGLAGSGNGTSRRRKISGPDASFRSVCGSRPLRLRWLAKNSALFQKPNANLLTVYADQSATAVAGGVSCKKQGKFPEDGAFNSASDRQSRRRSRNHTKL